MMAKSSPQPPVPSRPAQAEVVVIGAGPGGYAAAIALAKRGRQVVLVEKEAVGGTCLHWGCIPSKALIQGAALWDLVHHSGPQLGVRVASPEGLMFDWTQLVNHQRDTVQTLHAGVRQLLKKAGVTTLQGRAAFNGKTSLEITPPGDEENPWTMTFQQALVAVGGRPIILPEMPYDGRRVMVSDQVFSLEAPPDSLMVLGGGVIGLEMASLFSLLGVPVTVVEMAERLLPGLVDEPFARQLQQRLTQRGVTFRLGARCGEGRLNEALDEVEAVVADASGSSVVSAERLLLAVGREPNTAPLRCDLGGIRLDAKGFIETDAYGKTDNPNVYALGDCIAGPQLAHRASAEARIVSRAMAGVVTAGWDHQSIPAVVFTHPEVAATGLTLEQARALLGADQVKTADAPFMSVGRALTYGGHVAQEGRARWIVAADTGQILGAQVMGEQASELIAQAALAIELQASLAATIHAHPTLSEVWLEAAEAFYGHATHV
jgi:dihydrolipoamide dehydrogenase